MLKRKGCCFTPLSFVAYSAAAGVSTASVVTSFDTSALGAASTLVLGVAFGFFSALGAAALDFLSADLVRRNIWAFILVMLFTVVYVAFRYQCQQDMILIDKKESQLKDAKYKALSSSSTLTERCRESQVLRVLRQVGDSLLHVSDQPPYIINIPESGFFSGSEEE